MRTHAKIIDDAGPTRLGEGIGLEDVGRVYQWKRSNSVPGPYWKAIVDIGAASLEELADAADFRRRPANEAGAAA